jgi:hypothetical protein
MLFGRIVFVRLNHHIRIDYTGTGQLSLIPQEAGRGSLARRIASLYFFLLERRIVHSAGVWLCW